MNTAAAPDALLAPSSPPAPADCPLNHGLAVTDQLLAAITRQNDGPALDVALDFRLLLAHARDADTVLREFFRLRAVIEERHYLACFRLRRWLEKELAALVKLDRTATARRIALQLDVRSYDALCARCTTRAAGAEPAPATARVQFVPAGDLPDWRD